MTRGSNPADLKNATSSITPASLLAARSAIATDCALYVRWAEAISPKVESIKRAADLKKLARAAALISLGYLPTRPNTCPFCIQHARDLACNGCGYAETHGGKCDKDSSAFRQFIEAFCELGSAIYQDCDIPDLDLYLGLEMLHEYVEESVELVRRMPDALEGKATPEFMETKALFLNHAIALLPISLFREEVREKHKWVLEKLLDYW